MRNLALSFVCLVACACAAGSGSGSGPTTLFHNGRIYLGEPEWRRVDALLVRDGRVVAAGSADELEAQARGAQRVDLDGAAAFPGFQDAHGHLENLGRSMEIVDLRGATSYAEVVRRTADRARTLPAGAWVIGRGWDQNLWPDQSFPVRGPLDATIPDRMIVLERVDGHAVLVNAPVLALAGLDGDLRGVPPPDGGQILLDTEGRATGVLIDNAKTAVTARLPAPDEATRRRWILRAQDELLALGVTALHDMGDRPETLAVLRGLRDEGELKLRVIAYVWGNDRLDEEWLAGFPEAPDARDVFCVPGVKLMADGALGSRGAALQEEYSDAPGAYGTLTLDVHDMARRLNLCARLGLQPAVHAIGDRANREVLDLYERIERRDAGFANLRPRVEHAQILSRGDLVRFAELAAIPSMQPQHLTSDMDWAVARVGPFRLEGAYAWKSVAGGRSPLAFGSDCPVETPDVRLGLVAATTRRALDGHRPEGFPDGQELTMRQALAAYTHGAAYAVHQDDRRGRLEPGYAADLTVLDRDLLEIAPLEVPGARILMTVVNGEVVYRAAGH